MKVQDMKSRSSVLLVLSMVCFAISAASLWLIPVNWIDENAKVIMVSTLVWLGFAGGMVLVMLVLLLKYIFGSKIFTQTQFFNNFTQIRKIGVLKPTGKRSKLASFADLKTEDDSLLSADNNKKLISANFANITKEYGKVLITGTGDSKAAGEAVKAMGLKGDFKPDIFNSPDILKSIPDYDAVVLIEQRGNSLFRNVANEIELINNGGTKIVGAILI